VGDRIRVQEWLHSGRSLLPRCCVRYGSCLRHRLKQSQPFVGEKEKGLVFEDGAAKHSAEVILPLRRFWQMIEIREPIPGVQNIVAKIFKSSAVKLVGAGAGHDGDLAAGGATKLR